MKYKALFLDVDGTSVVHGMNNIPSPRVTSAVAQCMKAGVSVSLATSRPLIGVQQVVEHLRLNGLCVISSGAQIYDPQKKKIIVEIQFPKSAMRRILDIAQEYKKKIMVFDGEKEISYDGIHTPRKVVGMWFPELEPAILVQIHDDLASVDGITAHRMESWTPGFECLDITQKDASKLHGIVEVAKRLDVHTDEIIGVGDGYNDFPLLMACGLKIAMGNAVPELKEIADFVAPSVDEDGVATVIEKFILN